MAVLGDYDLRGLKDSRLFYLRNPPKFTHYTILVVVIILASAITWSCTAIKAEEVVNQGMVVDIGANSVATDVGGTIVSVDVREGDRVVVGDIILVMDSSAAEAERDGYLTQVNHYSKRLELIDRYIDSINYDQPNPFLNAGDEKEFYDLRVAYDSEIAGLTQQDQSDTIRMKYVSNQYSAKHDLEKTIIAGEAYKDVVVLDAEDIKYWTMQLDRAASSDKWVNPFEDEGRQKMFYEMLESFHELKNFYIDLQKQGDQYKAYEGQAYQAEESFFQQALSQITNLEKDKATQQNYVTAGNVAKARIAFVEEIIKQLEVNSKVNPFDPDGSELDREFYSIFQTYLGEVSQQGLDQKIDDVKSKNLQTMRSDKTNSSDQLRSQQASSARAEANIAKYTVRAVSEGSIHLNQNLEVGAFMQSGTSIGTINSDTGRQIEMQVSAHDRARITVGEECKFTVDGLLQSEYGYIDGTIVSVASDATSTEKGTYFKVVIQYDKNKLVDSHGNVVEVSNGMSVKVWTIYEKNTYMDFFLEKLLGK